jgi:uncharacterized protein DUF4384
MSSQRKQEEMVSPIQESISSTHRQRLLFALLLGMMFLVVCAAISQAQDTVTASQSKVQGWQGYEHQPLRVNIWHDKADDEIYRNDEPIRVHFDTNQDAYVVVYRIDTDGGVSVLWPRSRYDDGFVFGSHTYNLPAPGSRRIRTADQDGVEYIQAVVSAYPFDLRHLEVDFHHEPADVAFAYYVAGDPFLAMNDVNFAVTGLEDPEDFVATNYVSYYVGRRVDHPRYLCGQCHDDDVSYHPYHDTCTVEIHHDYGWDNDWYVRFGYFPAYHYPVYYYVDPWTARPWINYWYRPWYSWPGSRWHAWDHDYYVWNHSPYWRGDVSRYYDNGHRRYRPISKDVRYKRTADNVRYKNPDGMVKTAKPSSKMVKDMKARKVVPSTKTRTTTAGTRYRDTKADTRRLERTIKKTDTSPSKRPGIRMDRKAVNGEAVRKPAVRPTQTKRNTGSNESIRSGSVKGTTRDASSRTTVKPVVPRNKGSRIWSGGRSSTRTGSTTESKIKSRSKSSAGKIKPTTRSGSTSKKTPRPTVKAKPKPSTKSKSTGSKSKTSNSKSSGSGKTTKSNGGKSKKSR